MSPVGRDNRPQSTLTGRSICSRADAQKIKLPSVYGEFRQSRERPVPLRSLNDLVGAQQQRLQDRDPKCLRGLEVDDELELGRLFYWKIRGVGALQILVHVGRSMLVIRQQSA